MNPSAREPWTGLHPRDLADLLPPLPCPWWICGGWAIDLWLDRLTREHADTDIGCLRDDVPALRGALETWELYLAKDGQLQRLRSGQSVPRDVNSLWCRRAGAAGWDVQIMIEEADSSDWLFRRGGLFA